MKIVPRPGEAVTDGRSVTIGAPIIESRMQYPKEATPSQALGTMLRHLKGVMAAAEELRSLLEKQERERREGT